MKAIIITGTPGTGKTTVSKKLASLMNYTYIDVNEIIKKQRLSKGYDRKRNCKIIDVKDLSNALVSVIRDSKTPLIIDSHLSHFLSKRYVSLCIITRCNLKLLKSRLKRRDYTKQKIEENLEVEIMEVIPNEAAKHNCMFIDTDKKLDYKKMIRKIKRLI